VAVTVAAVVAVKVVCGGDYFDDKSCGGTVVAVTVMPNI
jgi:hypothetical protein